MKARQVRAAPLPARRAGVLCVHGLVRAVPETKFFPLVKMLLPQPVWARADPVAELQKMARLAGIGTDEFNSIRNRPLLAS